MKWFKENWFKVGILIAILIVSLPLAYYYGYVLPKNTRDADTKVLRVEDLKCKEKGNSDYGGRLATRNGWIISSDYIFSPQYQSCLAYSDISAPETGFHKEEIVNLDTGKDLYIWDNENNGSANCKKVLSENFCLTSEEFREKRTELFGE